jgi:hypothetical protein
MRPEAVCAQAIQMPTAGVQTIIFFAIKTFGKLEAADEAS